ncbi:winged helix-turn-helix domain-containing protein [Haloferax sp. Atlit-4N]|uniref:PhiH1 repressor n=1 Tax=Haloferax TaxID=2251 RepID=UPI000678DE19|nr:MULTISPECIES: PhiH1 repressor [Haloferax]RDZ54491.1 winged helix-turn-helix domain-containing protein [Haloferax sp. Atlit-4N]
MRLDADWMTRADDRILEFLSEEGPHPPKKMADDGRVRFGRQYIGVRCRDYLVPYGLAQNLGNGVYSITELGEQYLAGEIDAAELENSE